MNRNAYIYTTDSFSTRVYNELETIEMLGEEFLEEYGHVVSVGLLERYKNAIKEMESVEAELRVILEK